MTRTSLHNSLFFSTATSQSKTSSNSISERRDVIEKAVLRSIKRFYLNEFRKDNKNIIHKRYKNVTNSIILKGFIKTCSRLFGDIPGLNEIAQFLMIISSVKSTSAYKFSKEIQKKASIVNSVMHKYSYKKWKKIFEIRELGFAFKYVYENHPDYLSQAYKNKDNEIKEKCGETLEHWMMKFIQRSF